MDHELSVLPTAAELAQRAAELLADRIRTTHASGAVFNLALSGGRTPWAMIRELLEQDLPWHRVQVFQVDERVAPDGDPARNFTELQQILQSTAAELHPMPVTSAELDPAAAQYAASLPERFDLVHLGLGADGHTASLVPGDPVLGVNDRLVALTQPYQGHRRMTLTYPGLARANELLWLISGADKARALQQLLAGDLSIPASQVQASKSVILADTAATPLVRTQKG